MKYFIILILGSLVLFSCGKKQMIKVSAVNPVTGEGYAYLPFKIVEVTSGAFESNYKTVYEGELGADGKNAFDFRVKGGGYYKITTNNTNNDGSLPCYINNTSYTFAKNDSEFDFQFEYAPCAYIKLKIENVNCSGPDDLMNFRQKQSYTDWESWSSDREGCYIYESNDYFQVPAGWRIYEWEVDRGGNTNNFKDSTFLNEGEYKIFVMNY